MMLRCFATHARCLDSHSTKLSTSFLVMESSVSAATVFSSSSRAFCSLNSLFQSFRRSLLHGTARKREACRARNGQAHADAANGRSRGTGIKTKPRPMMAGAFCFTLRTFVGFFLRHRLRENEGLRWSCIQNRQTQKSRVLRTCGLLNNTVTDASVRSGMFPACHLS